MSELTRAEFYEKYGNLEVKFCSYFKYTFEFEGVTPDGGRVVVEYGGCTEQIYRFNLPSDKTFSVHTLRPYSGTVYDTKGNKIDYFYDF